MADKSCYPSEGQIRISGINRGENWAKLYNIGDTPVDLAGWVLYDENDSHELFVTLSDIINVNGEKSLLLEPHSEVVITGKNDTDFMLHKEGGEVRLYSGPVEMEGELEDEIVYPSLGEGENYKIDLGDEAISDSENTDTSVLNEQNVNQEILYRIPEDADSEVATKNLETTLPAPSRREHLPSAEGRKRENRTDFFSHSSEGDLRVRLGEGVEKASISNETGQYNNNKTFTASSKMEKSPYAWFYRLWGSWFIWRIILPLLGLWILLYTVIRYVRRRYLD